MFTSVANTSAHAKCNDITRVFAVAAMAVNLKLCCLEMNHGWYYIRIAGISRFGKFDGCCPKPTKKKKKKKKELDEWLEVVKAHQAERFQTLLDEYWGRHGWDKRDGQNYLVHLMVYFSYNTLNLFWHMEKVFVESDSVMVSSLQMGGFSKPSGRCLWKVH